MNYEVLSLETAKKIATLEKENKKLKKLCNEYEEEHNNEFQCWKKDRKELLDKRTRIDKAIEYIELGLANEEEAEELLNILNGVEDNE